MVDTNAKFLQDLVDISVKEKLNLNIFKHEINEANIKDTYDHSHRCFYVS